MYLCSAKELWRQEDARESSYVDESLLTEAQEEIFYIHIKRVCQ